MRYNSADKVCDEQMELEDKLKAIWPFNLFKVEALTLCLLAVTLVIC